MGFMCIHGILQNVWPPMGENYNKSKKDEPDVKHCPLDKVEYIKEALKCFNMISFRQ